MRRARVIDYKRTVGIGLGAVLMFFPKILMKLVRLLLPLLPVIVLVGLFLLPKTPHLRVQYTYRGDHEHKQYITCDYLGINGVVKVFQNPCPLILFLKERE